MKYKLKTRLLAALALSGASFCWPAADSFAQQDEYGFVRLARQQTSVVPSRDSKTKKLDSSRNVLLKPKLPPLQTPVGTANQRNSGSPVAFASSNVFQGSYVPKSGSNRAATADYVALQKPAGQQHAQIGFSGQQLTPPSTLGVSAPRDLPPIVRDTKNVLQPSSDANYQRVESFPAIVVPVKEPAADDYPPIVSQPIAISEPPIVREQVAMNQLPIVNQPIQMDQPPVVVGRRPVIGNPIDIDQPPIVATAPILRSEDVVDYPPIENGPIEINEAPAFAKTPTAANEAAVLDDSPTVAAAEPASVQPNSESIDTVRQAGGPSSMVESSYLVNADGSFDATSDVQVAGFGGLPLTLQDTGSPIDVSLPDAAQAVPGGIPSNRSFGGDSLLAPLDPITPNPTDTLGRPLNFDTLSAPSVVGNGLPVQDTGVFTPVVDQSLGGHSSVCGCQSCGANGCFDPDAVTAQFNTSGANALARSYFIAEALYYDRDDGFIDNSNFGTLNNFDFDGGWRFTVGRRTDSTRGREFTYTGTLAIEESRTSFSEEGLIQSNFAPVGTLNTTNLAAFFNATEQSEAKETFFHSLEFNRVRWGWDVLKSYVGLRYFLVDDSYSQFSQSIGTPALGIPPSQGFFQLDALNHLIGPHIGAELYYDVGYRWSLSGFSKLGVHANFNQLDTILIADGTTFIDAEDNSVSIAGSYEAGINAKFRVNRQSQFRVGYNILWLGELATASDNLVNIPGVGIPLAPSFGGGTTETDSDDLFFHGLSFGFEIYR